MPLCMPRMCVEELTYLLCHTTAVTACVNDDTAVTVSLESTSLALALQLVALLTSMVVNNKRAIYTTADCTIK